MSSWSGNTSSWSIQVKWEAFNEEYWNGPELQYRVYWKEVTANVNLTNMTSLTTVTVSVDIVDLQPFTNYSICVLTVNSFGEGPETCVYHRTAEWCKLFNNIIKITFGKFYYKLRREQKKWQAVIKLIENCLRKDCLGNWSQERGYEWFFNLPSFNKTQN